MDDPIDHRDRGIGGVVLALLHDPQLDLDVVAVGAVAGRGGELDAARSALKSGGILWVVLQRSADAQAVEEFVRNAEFAPRRRVDLSNAQQALAFVALSDRPNARPRTVP